MMMMLKMHLKNRKKIGEVIPIGNTIVAVRLLYPRRECVWPEIFDHVVFGLRYLIMLCLA